MNIKGLQRTTLLDFPGKVACTVFTGGCNLRCPFCHNASLVLTPNEGDSLSEDAFLGFLAKRKGILDGVCVTGGEPLLQKDLADFIRKIKNEGFAVKLDTNGSMPHRLRALIDEGLLDYVAMDVKNSEEKYALTAGIDGDCSPMMESIDLIMSSGVDYEFRTTVVNELHTVEDVEAIARRISGAKRYFLQSFKDSGDLIASGMSAPTEETLRKMQAAAAQYVVSCELRGV